MMKRSSSLLLLGLTCLFLLLVQEGQGLRCHIGTGTTRGGKLESEKDCSTQLEKDLHPSCQEHQGAERDYCVTQTLTLYSDGNDIYNKYCGCSKGLDPETMRPECQEGSTFMTCACNSDLCNDQYPLPPITTPKATKTPPSGGQSDATSMTSTLCLLLTTPFYWILY